MLKASDFNEKIDSFAHEILIPNGFKKSGLHYYKIDKNEYFALIKNTYKGVFDDYYLAYSHVCTGDFFNALKKKPSVMLKDYPVSIRVTDLPIVFKTCKNLIDSPYYFYHLSRLHDVNKKCIESERTWQRNFSKRVKRLTKLSTSKSFLNSYVKELFKLIEKYGFLFFEECDFNLCEKTINRAIIEKKQEQYMEFYLKFKEQIDTYKTTAYSGS